jgi:signal transduction histidine kinase
VIGIFIIRQSYGFFLFFILSILTIWSLPLRSALVWIGVIAMVTLLLDIIFLGWGGGVVKGVVDGLAYIIVAIGGSAVVRAENARQESHTLFDELQGTYRQLQRHAENVEELAVAEERNRLARELHDTLGHRLTVSLVQLEGAERLIPEKPERAAGMVNTVRGQLREGLRELRNTVSKIRTPLGMDLPLSKSLRHLTATFEKATRLPVHTKIPYTLPALPANHRIAIYHAAQETLTNIQRHSKAQAAWLELTFTPGTATLRVTDDGVGIPEGSESNGFGLRGLRERAAELNGQIEILHREGGGACLVFTLQFRPEEIDEHE